MPAARVPKTVWSQLGPVPVDHVEDLRDEEDGNHPLMGRANRWNRRISIRKGLDAVTTRQTLFHEWIHVVLYDAGVRLTPEQEESVCDAVATAMTAAGFKFTGRKRNT